MILRPPRSTRPDTPFPYTTLVRSHRCGGVLEPVHEGRDLLRQALLPLAPAWLALVGGADVVDIRHRAQRELGQVPAQGGVVGVPEVLVEGVEGGELGIAPHQGARRLADLGAVVGQGPRSAEHTSDLQSLMRRTYAVLFLYHNS